MLTVEHEWSVPLCHWHSGWCSPPVPRGRHLGITSSGRFTLTWFINQVLLIPSLQLCCFSPWRGPAAFHLASLLHVASPPTHCSCPSSKAPHQTISDPTCPSGLSSISHWEVLAYTFWGICASLSQMLSVPLNIHHSWAPWPIVSIYQHTLPASLHTTVEPTSAWYRLGVPNSSYLPGSTLSLWPMGIGTWIPQLCWADSEACFILPPRGPQQDQTPVAHSALLDTFPSYLTSFPWTPSEYTTFTKCLPTICNWAQSCQRLGDSVEQSLELSQLGA